MVTFVALAHVVDASDRVGWGVGDVYVPCTCTHGRCTCQERRKGNLLRWCESLGDSSKLSRNSISSCVAPKLGIFSCHVRLGCSFQKSLRSRWHAVIDNGRVWNPFCIMTLEDFVLLSRWAARVFKAHGLQSASNMQWFWPTFLPAWNRQFWHYLLLHFQNI